MRFKKTLNYNILTEKILKTKTIGIGYLPVPIKLNKKGKWMQRTNGVF